MTWQRIDENTFIDDTLVTCAEYQLFIDEMREQGKYYQPDHWTSYQFPTGQAREPILGVRYSDAVNFCNWLTQRETQNWKYDLPIKNQGINFLMKHLKRHTIGYWMHEERDNYAYWFPGFVWISLKSSNPRQLEHEKVLAHASKITVINNIKVTLDYSRYLDVGSIKSRYPVSVILNKDPELKRFLDYIVDRSSVLAKDFGDTLNFIANRDGVSLRELFIDIYTLQERIAGRSPAFEGIRLVRKLVK